MTGICNSRSIRQTGNDNNFFPRAKVHLLKEIYASLFYFTLFFSVFFLILEERNVKFTESSKLIDNQWVVFLTRMQIL